MGKYRVLLESPPALAAFCERYGILDDVHVHLRKDSIKLDDGPDYTCMLLVAIIDGEMRFPFNPLLRECMSSWTLAPIQLFANVYRVVIGVYELNRA